MITKNERAIGLQNRTIYSIRCLYVASECRLTELRQV